MRRLENKWLSRSSGEPGDAGKYQITKVLMSQAENFLMKAVGSW